MINRPFHSQPWWNLNNHGFMYQRMGSHILLMYPPQFDPQWSKDEIAEERFQQVNCDFL